jgi:hypothetical protein
VRDLAEITDAVLVSKVSAAGWVRVDSERRPGYVEWWSGDTLLIRPDTREIREPFAAACRAAHCAELTGECPVCGAVVRALRAGEEFDTGTMQWAPGSRSLRNETIGAQRAAQKAAKSAADAVVEAGGSQEDAENAIAEALDVAKYDPLAGSYFEPVASAEDLFVVHDALCQASPHVLELFAD